MTVKELIEQLKVYHKPNDDLIVAYWERDMFGEIPKGEWGEFANHVEAKMDWSSDHEVIEWMWDEYNKERKELTIV